MQEVTSARRGRRSRETAGLVASGTFVIGINKQCGNPDETPVTRCCQCLAHMRGRAGSAVSPGVIRRKNRRRRGLLREAGYCFSLGRF